MTSTHNNDLGLKARLEHQILHGLACEWKTLMGILPFKYQDRMRMPLMRLKRMKSRLGYWSGEKQEICLSRNFVLNHSWGDVREVLRHEMAHQFAEQVLGSGHQTSPHGSTFQQACYLLRANPKASGKIESWSGNSPYGLTDTEVKMIRQIKKLMALAGSQNINEAKAALSKAHMLIGKYNIDMQAHSDKREFISLLLGKPALRHFRESYHLVNLLIDFYFVEGIWVPAYVLEKGKMGRVLEITGTVPNVEIASYVYDFVKKYSHYRWCEYNRGKGLNRYRKTDFEVGIIEGFRSKLVSSHMQKDYRKDQFPLVKLRDPQLSKFMSYKYPRVKRIKRGISYQGDHVIKDGIDIGKKMVIAKGIKNKVTVRKLLREETPSP